MGGSPAALIVPAEVKAVFRAFRTCEFSTLAKDGTPITWPTLPFWDEEQQRFIVTTSYLAQRRLPRPTIPWADIIRINCEAQANLRARGERS